MLKPSIQNQFDELERIIRNGERTECPSLLYQYLQLGDKQVKSRPNVIQFKTHERMFKTLLDTICDPLIATHWRHICLDNIYRPLLDTQKRAYTCCQRRHVLRLYQELAVVSQYFL